MSKAIKAWLIKKDNKYWWYTNQGLFYRFKNKVVKIAKILNHFSGRGHEVVPVTITEGICEWTYDHENSRYETSCGNKLQIYDDFISFDEVHYCYFKGCGKPIKEIK